MRKTTRTAPARAWIGYSILGILASLAVLSCGESVAPPPGNIARSSSAVLVELSGTIHRLGSTESNALAEESPGWTRFAHDVWMDTTEMTQGEFEALLGRNPSSRVGEKLPVTDVTWFDAVLAANARSRRDGLDTVYEYESVTSGSTAVAGGLGGLVVHLDRDGWRLPTEAEWEAVARAGSSTEWAWGTLADSALAGRESWYLANSGGRLHEVATRSANRLGLYDLAGNAMEWVGDWKGPFPKDTLAEFAGQESPADVPEIPLKGGAYLYDLRHLRPSSRGATYAAFRGSRAEYVGFRLARGRFAARFLDATGATVEAPPVTLVRTDLVRVLNAWEAKLVFLNRVSGRNILTWVDFAESSPVVRTLPDPDPVFHPVISPDGRWVAWSTTLEGSSDPSRIKARRLVRGDTVVLDLGRGSIPRWWTDGTDTFLVRAEALDNTMTAWGATTTTARRWSDGVLSPTVDTWAKGSFHDGRSGPYLFTGYRRLLRYDLRDGSRRTLFTGPGNGKAEGDTSQVCNVSAAPDASGRSLFLDFGFSGVSSVVGRPYGIHEIAFMADSAGRIVGQIPSPIGVRQWEHMEWSNVPRWAVSGSIDADGAYRELYAVDLENGVSTLVAKGQELWQPALWVGRSLDLAPGSADLDSAANYVFGEFAVRGAQFWARADSLEGVFLGSSHMANGLVPSAMRSVKSQLLAFAGSGPFDQDEIVRRYVLPHAPKLKVVGLSLMPGWLYDPVQNYSRSPWYQWRSTAGYLYDRDHAFWIGGTLEGHSEIARWRADHAADRADYDASGTQIARIESEGWSSAFSNVSPIAKQDSTMPDYAANLAILQNLVRDLTLRGIRVVIVKFPESPAYRDQECATRYGPSRAEYAATLERVRGWERLYTGFRFFDANMDGRHDYTDAEATNSDHLNLVGARKFTTRLDSVVADLLAKP